MISTFESLQEKLSPVPMGTRRQQGKQSFRHEPQDLAGQDPQSRVGMPSKRAVALKLNPDLKPRNAVVRLSRLIRRDTLLREALQRVGYRWTQRYFTPRQVQILNDYLGLEP